MKRIKRVITWGFLFSIFIFFIFGSDLISAQSKSGVKVPNVLGMTEAEARAAIEAAGLSFGGARVSPNRAPKPSDSGRVQSSQYPRIGEGLADGYAKPGTPVTVELWAAHGVKVPNVAGMTVLEAKAAIEAVGLSYGGATANPNRTPRPSDAGRVAYYHYSKAEKDLAEGYATLGTPVTVVLYGPYSVKVPNVAGMTVLEAKAAIEAVGLSYGGATVNPNRTPRPSDAGRVAYYHYSKDVKELEEGYATLGTPVTVVLYGPYGDKDRCSQIEAALIAASQAKDINRFRTLVEQARLENCNFYQSAYNHLRNWEQQLQGSATQPQPQPPQQVSPIQSAWQGSWTLVSKHTGGKFRGASVRSQLTVSFQNNQVKVTFGKYTAVVKSITLETLVYEVTSGGNKITTTLHRVNRGIKGNFQGVHVATGEGVMGEFRSDPPP